MLTDVQIINLGLSKIAANRIARIDPARTPLEAFMASNYVQWKRSELTKRRWVFALVEEAALTQVEDVEGRAFRYKYAIPNDCLRPLRQKNTDWVQRGRFLYSNVSGLTLNYIKDAKENEFETLFNDVLACRVAYESAEYVTQSTSKKDYASGEYDKAIKEAGQANAFVIGPEDVGPEDDGFTWLVARHG